jgi:hypothetical protein
MLTGLSSLKKLTINLFKNLTGIVSLPATLEYVDLKDNAISVIKPDAFRLLNKLKNLNLDRNKFTADKVFPALANLAHLEQLSLDSNKIDSLEGLKVIQLPHLRVLKLFDNKVTQLSKHTFATLPGLVILYLDYNRIADIETGAFDGLTNLRVLDLSDNKLSTFCFNVFESAANELGPPVNLMSLDIDTDSIYSVRWSTETDMLEDNMPKAKKTKKIEADEAARLFGKCGFRNRLDVQCKKMPDRSFLEALAAWNFVRLSFNGACNF